MYKSSGYITTDPIEKWSIGFKDTGQLSGFKNNRNKEIIYFS